MLGVSGPAWLRWTLDGNMNATLADNESSQPRPLLLRIALVSAAWIVTPYLVYWSFGSGAGNGAAALGLTGWVMAVLVPVIKRDRQRMPEGAKGSVYVFVLFSFIIGLGCTALYLWLCD